MGESDEPGPFESVVNLMPDDANAYPAYRAHMPTGQKKSPRNCGDFSLQADLIPIPARSVDRTGRRPAARRTLHPALRRQACYE